MIRILEDQVVNRIAAGEVVERPASVVKELLENSLDAGATRVDITLKAGGRSLVRIADDGCGMGRQDAMLCIERHATSKIRDESDLFAIATLGFRGEALPSIASVSRFEITTRRADEEVGTRLRLEGGTLLGVDDAGCAAGTCIDVRSLFFNVPARRKFLRTEATELGHCVEAVLREALIRPEVDFAVVHDGRELIRAPRARDRADRAVALLGEHGRTLVPVSFAASGFEVDGLVSPVGVHKADAAGSTYLFVNGRFVRDPVVRRALNEAYRGVVPKGRHPVVVLEVRLDPAMVDVNVHPSKTEVRFRDPFELVRVVSEGLREALERHGIRRSVERVAPPDEDRDSPMPPLPLQHRIQPPQRDLVMGPADPRRAPAATVDEDASDGLGWLLRSRVPTGAAPRGDASAPALPLTTRAADGQRVEAGLFAGHVVERVERPTARNTALPAHPDDDPSLGRAHPLEFVADTWEPPAQPSSQQPTPPSQERPPSRRFRDLRVIGQLMTSFVLCEGEGALVLLDLHAALERVTLHQLRLDGAASSTQRLLTPAMVEIPPASAPAVRESLDLLRGLGLDVEAFGPASFAVTGVPTLLERSHVPTVLRDLAAVLVDGRADPGRVRQRLLATVARHHAAAGLRPLSEVEIRSVLAALDESEDTGRPVLATMSKADLQRLFR